MLGIQLAEKRLLPDALVRVGIRSVVRKRLRQITKAPTPLVSLIDSLSKGPIAIATETANDQHYEVDPEFFELVLGNHRKYSCGYWPRTSMSLDESEKEALDLLATRADLRDGQRVLDVGCGWGSFSLYAAERYPSSEILAVSNSEAQRETILALARERGIHNLRVVTTNIATASFDEKFDRIISVEMFEHMRNYRALLDKLMPTLQGDGLMFLHVFCHRDHGYTYEDDGKADWMARHFFTGGVMPSYNLLPSFVEEAQRVNQWFLSGTHYARTARGWLGNLDRYKAEATTVLSRTYGEKDAELWLQRWRMFFMAVEELFAFESGSQWGVAHYVFSAKELERSPRSEVA